MNKENDILWRHIEPRLRGFAERITASDSAIRYLVAKTSNDAFLLRGYASFRKSTSDDEIAVTIDAALKHNAILLSTDACTEDGEVLAAGPTTTIPIASPQSMQEKIFADWLGNFEVFLVSAEGLVKDRVVQYRKL